MRSQTASLGITRGIVRILALALIIAALPAMALKGDEEQPILIEADDVEVLEADSISVYVGNVVVTQGSMRLTGDHVTVYHREDRRPRFVIALGAPAHLKQRLDNDQGELLAFAKRMEFDVDKDELTLIGEGLLIQGEDRVTGERIVYDRARAHFRAGGAGRVRITIVPEKE
jgi:lipopolysaccharide export system protein LptA